MKNFLDEAALAWACVWDNNMQIRGWISDTTNRKSSCTFKKRDWYSSQL